MDLALNSIARHEAERTPAHRILDLPKMRSSARLRKATNMIRIGYAPGAFDLFHIGHLHLLRRAKERCDYLIAGVVSDEFLIAHKGVTPVVPLAERIEIVPNSRHVDAAHAAMTDDKLEIWWDLRFNVFFKGDDWQDTDSRETGKIPRRAPTSSGNSPKSVSRSPIFHIRRRHQAVGCAGPCKT